MTATPSSATGNTLSVTGFEFFQGNATESRTRPQITVRRGGLMVLTRAAVDLLGNDVTHVQLAHNPKTGAVGVRACDAEVSGCYRLRQQKNSPSWLVGGKRFFRHHDLDIDKARTYDAQEFGQGIVGFRLNGPDAEMKPEPVPAKSASRRKSKAA